MAQCCVRLSVCRLWRIIVAERCFLPKNCLKKQIGNGLWRIEWSHVTWSWMVKVVTIPSVHWYCWFWPVKTVAHITYTVLAVLNQSFNIVPPICLQRNNSKTAEDGYKWPPIGNGIWRIKWSRDWGRHMTLKCEGHDSWSRLLFWAHYLDNGCRYRLGCNGAPIGNVYLCVKWSSDRRRQVTRKVTAQYT